MTKEEERGEKRWRDKEGIVREGTAKISLLVRRSWVN